MSNALPTNIELVDAILASDAIADSTRVATRRALNLARENGRDFPSPSDCTAAAVETGATPGTVCAAWGYVRSANDMGEWLNARQTYADPERDERRGVFKSTEAVMMFMAFCTLCKVPPPFQFEFQRPSPRRKR